MQAGKGTTLTYDSWPLYDEALLVQDTVNLPLQVRGLVWFGLVRFDLQRTTAWCRPNPSMRTRVKKVHVGLRACLW